MPNKIQKLIDLIAKLDPSVKGNFTKSNKPDCSVLAELLGDSVSGAERDEAFAAFTAQYPQEAELMLATLEAATAEPTLEPTKAEPGEIITGQDALKFLREKGHKV